MNLALRHVSSSLGGALPCEPSNYRRRASFAPAPGREASAHWTRQILYSPIYAMSAKNPTIGGNDYLSPVIRHLTAGDQWRACNNRTTMSGKSPKPSSNGTSEFSKAWKRLHTVISNPSDLKALVFSMRRTWNRRMVRWDIS